MKMLLMVMVVVSSFMGLVDADCYMHTPRGSNNRNNERSANRRNANRVFDSQNNNRGGYNVGDLTSGAAGNNHKKQYQMTYYMSPLDVNGKSVMPIEWTNQHGCGGNDDNNPHKLNCNIVIQMMCQPHEEHSESQPKTGEIRDGVSTNTNDYQAPQPSETYEKFKQRWMAQEKKDRALNENFQWYDKCRKRSRNKGLFTADQKTKDDRGATSTRQNPNGNRRGYECPEERDYYPYWHPTAWKDIMVLAENKSRCAFYEEESFNVKPKHECVEKWEGEKPTDPLRHYSEHNNEESCKNGGGKWTEFHNYLEILEDNESDCRAKNGTDFRMKSKLIWGRPMYEKDEKCLVKLDPPICEEAPFSRVNHLGNGADLEPLHVQWKIPAFPSRKAQKCVLRIRYNISTDDYDPITTDHKFNGINSPVKNNPNLEIGLPGQTVRLAINTAQFGRTFQDRSHVFRLRSFDKLFKEDNQTLYTVQVRGKRGNIVQTFPAVEYDFFPTDLVMKDKDMVFLTWTGSNTHNNRAPGGDGQTGDAGQGTGGTDRSNVCGLGDRSSNFILPAMHKDSICHGIKTVIFSAVGLKDVLYPIDAEGNETAKLDACIQLMSVGYYKCFGDENSKCQGHSLKSKQVDMSDLLNNCPASFPGIVLQLKPGTYNYTCSRNNNFTNRSQKATIVVES